MSQMKNDQMSRRRFVGASAVAGAVAAGIAAASATAAFAGETSPAVPEAWDAETDVLVIGMGAAGLSAAVAAKLEGVERVMCLEAAPEEECGGTTRCS